MESKKSNHTMVITRPQDSLLSSMWSTSHDSLPLSAAAEMKVKENKERAPRSAAVTTHQQLLSEGIEHNHSNHMDPPPYSFLKPLQPLTLTLSSSLLNFSANSFLKPPLNSPSPSSPSTSPYPLHHIH